MHDGRRARGDASRQAILDATVRLIAAGGLTSVTHRAVAAEAQVSAAATTYHFATLDDLLQATLTSLSAEGFSNAYRSAYSARPVRLTPREADVLQLLLQSQPNKLIARRLGMHV